MIEAVNINKFFGDKHVLKNISCLFEKGNTNLIIGQSGSGKTVLMKCLVGLYEVDSGQVLYNSRDFHGPVRTSKVFRVDVKITLKRM